VPRRYFFFGLPRLGGLFSLVLLLLSSDMTMSGTLSQSSSSTEPVSCKLTLILSVELNGLDFSSHWFTAAVIFLGGSLSRLWDITSLAKLDSLLLPKNRSGVILIIVSYSDAVEDDLMSGKLPLSSSTSNLLVL